MLTRRGARDVFWSGIEAGSAALFSCVTAFVVARMIGPAEVGIAAAALAPHIVCWVLVNALLADAVVQRPCLPDSVVGEAFAAALLAGILALLACAAAGPALAALLGDPRLVPMSLALALPLPLAALAGVAQGLLTRRRDYRRLALRPLAGQGIGTVCALLAVFAGAGAWSLVAQQAVSATLGAAVLLAGRDTRPWFRRPGRAALDLLRLGLPLAATPLIQAARYRLFALLVGASTGPAALGQIHIAFRLVDTLRDLCATALWRLLLPRFAAKQADAAALQAATDRALAAYGALLFPAFGALFVTVGPIVDLCLGPAWQPAAEAARPLIALAVWMLLLTAGGTALIARGQPRAFVVVNVAATVITVVAIGLLRPRDPLMASLAWIAAQAVATLYALDAMARGLNAGRLRQCRAGLPALAVAAAATFAALLPNPTDPAARIAERLAAGAAVALPGLLVLHGRPAWRPA